MSESKAGRFASLKQLKHLREASDEFLEDSLEESSEIKNNTLSANSSETEKQPSKLTSQKTEDASDQFSTPKKPVKRGRPAGRRSNPDYTQISAYIPLELLLSGQSALSKEQRLHLKRTPRPVSDLVEELLYEWLRQNS
jgi:hypothetical protein